MRIVGGRWKGRQLNSPASERTRPTQDRVREAIASMVLAQFDFCCEGLSMLDAFAGTGAMGFEMLSRGFSRVVFCEKDRRAGRILASNARELGVGEAATLVFQDVRAYAESADTHPFNVVYLDPPYALDPELSLEVLGLLASRKLLYKEACVVHERAANAQPLTHPALELIKEKRYASSYVSLFKWKG